MMEQGSLFLKVRPKRYLLDLALPWEKTDQMWEGRLAIQGRMNKSKIGMELAANTILTKMGIPIDEKRQKYEDKAR